MGEQSDVHVSSKTAKGIIRKYGKRKDFMNLEDCQRVIKRRNENISSIKQSARMSPRSNKLI